MTRPPLLVILCGGLLAALVAFAFLGPSSATAPHAMHAANAAITPAEADAWAEARAADTPAAYRVYLAAYPSGAFRDEAEQALGRGAVAPSGSVAVHRPSAAQIALSCRTYVDSTLPPPSRVARIGGGAAGGCGVGLLAGGNDGRNCVIGAVVGGGVGAFTVEHRERRRRQEVQACVANGGPPG